MAGVSPSELVERYPLLYHMAERDSLPSILKHGLLSTSGLLDLYSINGTQRKAIESELRGESIPINHAKLGKAVVRDQCPMSLPSLTDSLQDGLTPRQWLHILNARVFFWVAEDRLHGLLNARSYAEEEHDVLILDTKSVVKAHLDDVDLCPMNSGATIPWKHPRGKDTFLPLPLYPWHQRAKKVVELTVRGGVTDVKQHLVEAWRMKGKKRLSQLA
jgi:hypothetical protein